jgi:hypothetical protein
MIKPVDVPGPHSCRGRSARPADVTVLQCCVRSGTFGLSGITVDCAQPQLLADFWAALLERDVSVPLPGWLRLGTLGEAQPVINFQPVPEPKRGKTRIHLDVVVDDIERGVETVTRLGGRSLQQRYDYDEGVVVLMADPEGNEFCLVQYFATPAG